MPIAANVRVFGFEVNPLELSEAQLTRERANTNSVGRVTVGHLGVFGEGVRENPAKQRGCKIVFSLTMTFLQF